MPAASYSQNLHEEYDMDRLDEKGYLFFKDATEVTEVDTVSSARRDECSGFHLSSIFRHSSTKTTRVVEQEFLSLKTSCQTISGHQCLWVSSS
mmetsp:Transcript_28110/g.68463  ORF Transcript_28110/g.68463 Transcript_28110/m.68463 type:complete len:93 (+) Transcript_28110:200-478(+)